MTLFLRVGPWAYKLFLITNHENSFMIYEDNKLPWSSKGTAKDRDVIT